MSLSNSEQTTYLTARQGKLCQNVPEGTPKAHKRIKKDTSTAYELRYDTLVGHIVDVAKKTTNWDNPETGQPEEIRSWVITVIDESWQQFKVEIAYNSSYAKHFFNRLPRLDFREQVKIKVGESKHETDPTKMRPWLSTSQNGTKTIPMWTKEAPGNLPQLEVTEKDGKKHYDDSKMMAFYEEMLNDFKYGFQHPDGTPTYTREEPETKPEIIGTAIEKTAQETDDLPF